MCRLPACRSKVPSSLRPVEREGSIRYGGIRYTVYGLVVYGGIRQYTVVAAMTVMCIYRLQRDKKTTAMFVKEFRRVSGRLVAAFGLYPLALKKSNWQQGERQSHTAKIIACMSHQHTTLGMFRRHMGTHEAAILLNITHAGS